MNDKKKGISPRYLSTNTVDTGVSSKPATHAVPYSAGNLDDYAGHSKVRSNGGSLTNLNPSHKDKATEQDMMKYNLIGHVKKELAAENFRGQSFVKKIKDIESLISKSKNKKRFELQLDTDIVPLPVRPQTTKYADSNTHKDPPSVMFANFNTQLKRNSAAQLHSYAHLFENNIQSTRSAVDKTEKNLLESKVGRDGEAFHGRVDAARNYQSENPKKYDNEDGEDKYEAEANIENIVAGIAKNTNLSQIRTNPNAKFLLLRKQVQEKRATRELKSAGQALFESGGLFKAAELNHQGKVVKRGKNGAVAGVRDGYEVSTGLPDTADSMTKNMNHRQLTNITYRVKKILELHRGKEKTWEEEKRLLIAEMQVLREHNQRLLKQVKMVNGL